MHRVLCFLASLLLVGAAWGQPVTFGASVQLTGPVANTGRYYKDAYEFAVDGVTVLLVEQDVHAALSVADRGYVMETGEIVREGSARELENDPEVQRAYLG
jgi:ABC-type cobalamin transport system ATPase subunit